MTSPDIAANAGRESYDREFFESQSDASLRSARFVLEYLFSLWRPQRVLDVGCGVGSWVRACQELGVTDAIGIDGDWVDRSMLLIDPSCFIAANIATQRLAGILGDRAVMPFDLAICVEVAEHLPFDRARSFVEDLVACSDVILFSAAVPFQYGTQHINEQWPEFWAILFRAQGFACFDCLRPALWTTPNVDWWYAQNALVFVREGSAASLQLPENTRTNAQGLSLIHPENLLANLLGLPRRYRQAAASEEVHDFRTLAAANLQGDTTLPPLAALARAAAADPDARNVFPWTRTETYQPEEEIAALARSLAETGNYLQAANEIVREERSSREQLKAELHLEQADRERLRAELDLEQADRERLRAELALMQAEHKRLNAELVRFQELETRLHAQASARQLAETALADNRTTEAERRQALEMEAARFASVRRATLAELNDARNTLVAEAERLQQSSTEIERRRTELSARTAPIEAIQRSLPWRAGRRLLRVVGLLPKPADMPAAPAAPPFPVPDVPTLELPEHEERPEVPEARLIKLNDKVVAEVRWWNIAAAAARLRLFDPFDAEDYLRRNSDVAAAGIDPYDHFIQSGAFEGRGKIDSEDLARLLGTLTLFDNAVRARPSPNPENDLSDDGLAQLIADVGPIGIFVSTRGNVFMNDLAEDLATDLRQVGVDVKLLDETSSIDWRPPVSLYIAPHEFFTLGKGPEWVRDDVLSEAFLFGTEQLQTTWFQTSLPFILMARGMLDICVQNAELFARTNMAALHVLPGLRRRPHGLTKRDQRHPLFGVLPESAQRDAEPSTPFLERPIDISFFGASSPRRDKFFARNAAFFSEYETFNYCRRPGRGPLLRESSDGALTRLAGHVAGHSKISLNIHQGEFGYFEWHRMVRNGMCSGSLVVSDPCLPHPNFVAGEHYLQENSRHIPDLLEWLLRTEDGAREAERVRGNVDHLITKTYDTQRATVQLLRFLSFHRARPENG